MISMVESSTGTLSARGSVRRTCGRGDLVGNLARKSEAFGRVPEGEDVSRRRAQCAQPIQPVLKLLSVADFGFHISGQSGQQDDGGFRGQERFVGLPAWQLTRRTRSHAHPTERNPTDRSAKPPAPSRRARAPKYAAIWNLHQHLIFVRRLSMLPAAITWLRLCCSGDSGSMDPMRAPFMRAAIS